MQKISVTRGRCQVLCASGGLRDGFPVPDAGGVADGLSIIVIMANKYAAQVLAASTAQIGFDGAKISKVFGKAK